MSGVATMKLSDAEKNENKRKNKNKKKKKKKKKQEKKKDKKSKAPLTACAAPQKRQFSARKKSPEAMGPRGA